MICLLQHLKFKQHFDEIVSFVVQKLNLSFLNNQKLYLKYIEGVFHNVSMNPHPIAVKKIVLSRTLFVKLLKEHAEDPVLSSTPNFKPYIQIFEKNQILYNSFDVS